MAVVHFIEANIIFDVNELYFVKLVEEDDKCRIIARFKSHKDEVILGDGTKEECKTKLSKLIEHLQYNSDHEDTATQWAYGTYYEILCNLNNVNFVRLGTGVDPDGWHIEVIVDNNFSDPVPITYSDLDESTADMEKLADGIRFNQKVISLQDGVVNEEENTKTLSQVT